MHTVPYKTTVSQSFMKASEYQSMTVEETRHWWFVSRRLFVASILESAGIHPTSGKNNHRSIADIGAGIGGMVGFLTPYGTVTGIEPSPIARTLASDRGIRLLNGRAEHTGQRAASFDIVCLFDVLYHRGVDDHTALREAYRILKPGGTLVVTDCAFPWLLGPHDVIVEARQRYTMPELVGKIRQAGFSVTRKTYMYFLIFPVFAAKRLLDRFIAGNRRVSDLTSVPSLLSVIAIGIHHIEAWGLRRSVSFPWGSSLCVVALKH